VFDLHWLSRYGGLGELSIKDLKIRLAAYPDVNPFVWLDKALVRRAQLCQSHEMVLMDLKRWLPSSWLLTKEEVELMIEMSVRALDQGVELMRSIQAQLDSFDAGGLA